MLYKESFPSYRQLADMKTYFHARADEEGDVRPLPRPLALAPVFGHDKSSLKLKWVRWSNKDRGTVVTKVNWTGKVPAWYRGLRYVVTLFACIMTCEDLWKRTCAVQCNAGLG